MIQPHVLMIKLILSLGCLCFDVLAKELSEIHCKIKISANLRFVALKRKYQ